MAGHSKWANIKHRKAAADAKKGKVFTRLIKEITVAAKLGGGDPNTNPRLRLAMEKAREANMTKDSVTSAIKRGSGQLDGVSYEEVRYEGYGVGGAAVMVDCLTDNRTRTVAEVRHAFTKNGGNVGSDGSVAYLFKHCGQFLFAPGTSEDKVMEAAIDAGRSEEHTSELQSLAYLVCRLLLEKKKTKNDSSYTSSSLLTMFRSCGSYGTRHIHRYALIILVALRTYSSTILLARYLPHR